MLNPHWRVRKGGTAMSSISSILSSYSSYYSDLYSSLYSGSSSSITSLGVSTLAENIDSDGDDSWSYDEVASYASDYYELTGDVISTEDIFSTYDTDGDHALNASEQAAALEDDALGIESASSDSDSDTSLLSSVLSSDSSYAYEYLMSSLTQESTSSLMSQMFNTDDTNSSLLDGIYGTTSTAEAAEAYWISQYGDEASSTVDVTA